MTVYARNSPPPLKWPDSGWVQVSPPTTIGGRTAIPLSSGSARYRYWLVWITNIGGHEQLAIDEITLYH